MGKFEIFKDRGEQYRFRLKAGNGEIILASEGYTTKASADNGIASVRTHAPTDSNYEKNQSSAGYSFNLKARNGEIIGRSESYTTAQGRDNGIESVKTNAPSAQITDLT